MTGTVPVLVHLAGPLRVDRDGRELAPAEIGSRKGRALLRLLAARRGDVLTGAEIAAVLWPEDLPSDPDAVVASLVSRLRRVLGAGAVVGGRSGYRLRTVEAGVLPARPAPAAARPAAGGRRVGRAGACVGRGPVGRPPAGGRGCAQRGRRCRLDRAAPGGG